MKYLKQPLNEKGEPSKGYTEGKCDNCGIVFWERTCDYARSDEHFHNRKCYNSSKKGTKRESFQPWRKNRVPVKTYLDYCKEAAERELRLVGVVSPEIENAIVFHEEHPTFLRRAAEVEESCGGMLSKKQAHSMLKIATIEEDVRIA